MQNTCSRLGRGEEKRIKGGHGDFNFTWILILPEIKNEASAANCCGFHKAGEWVGQWVFMWFHCSLLKIFPKQRKEKHTINTYDLQVLTQQIWVALETDNSRTFTFLRKLWRSTSEADKARVHAGAIIHPICSGRKPLVLKQEKRKEWRQPSNAQEGLNSSQTRWIYEE